MPKGLPDKLLDIYGDGGEGTGANYYVKHSGDIGISVSVVIAFSLVIGYLQVLSSLQVLKADWHNRRCDPTIMPFAGVIAAPEGANKLQYATDNFVGCAKNTLTAVADTAFKPVTMSMDGFGGIFSSISTSSLSLTTFFDFLRKSIAEIPVMIYSMLLNVLIPLRQGLRAVSDIIQRLGGSVIVSLRLAESTKLLVQSIVNLLIDFAIGMLVIMAIAILVFLALAWLPGMMWVANAAIIIMVALVIILLIIFQMLQSAFGHYYSGASVPDVPGGCFHPDTRLRTADGRDVEMADLKLGEKLTGNSTVRCKMKISNIDGEGHQREKMYVFGDSGTKVTGSHLVFDDEINDFISVQEAYLNGWPDVTKTEEATDSLVCLITSNHIIRIGEHIFHDWEDNNV